MTIRHSMYRGEYLILLALLVLPQIAHADVGPLGTEFQVNTYTTGLQTEPVVAAQSNGDFAVVWLSDGEDGDGGGIFARGFDSTGTPLGGETQINLTSMSTQGSPAVAAVTMDTGFGLAPTFQSVWASTQAGGLDVFGLEPGFFPTEFEVNTYTTGNQTIPRVAGLAGGGFVVAWHDADMFPPYERLFGRVYDTSYAPLAAPFQIGSIANPGNRYSVALAGTTGGGFVVSWTDDYFSKVKLYVYDSTGSVISTGASVGTASSLSDVAAAPSGGAVLVWDNDASDDIFGVRTNSFGAPVGSEFQINTYTTGAQLAPRVASNSAGEFLVTWISPHDGDGTGIFARLYDSSGVPAGTEFQINSFATGDLDYPSAAALPDGNFVVTWHDYDRDDVFARRLGDLCPATPTGGCRGASKSVLLLKNNSDDNKDKLLWKWLNGQTTSAPELGDPTTTRRYALCVYDTGGRVLSAEVPPDASKWKNLQYKDTAATAHGIRKVILKPGASNDTKVLVKGKGANLPDLSLGALSAPVTAQLINNETGVCFEHVFGSGEIVKQDTTLFKAKSP